MENKIKQLLSTIEKLAKKSELNADKVIKGNKSATVRLRKRNARDKKIVPRSKRLDQQNVQKEVLTEGK